MRIVTATLICLMLGTPWPATAAAADGPPRLSHNPFSRPPSEVSLEDQNFLESDDGSGPEFALRATMVGHENRLANVAGRILKPGDEIQGYLLVAVQEEYAVFKRDSKTITVYVKPHLEEDNE
jgi:hypothetical protein